MGEYRQMISHIQWMQVVLVVPVGAKTKDRILEKHQITSKINPNISCVSRYMLPKQPTKSSEMNHSTGSSSILSHYDLSTFSRQPWRFLSK